MKYTIQNEFLTVVISDLGAEIMSVKDSGGHEYLWQGDEKYWSGRAPIMFPICGRLFNGEYTYLGKTYTLPNHGFARKSVFSLKSAARDFITLELCANEETREIYPFEFIFDVTFALNSNTLDVKYEVKNKDTKELIFSVGGHPAFNAPLDKGLSFEDCYVEFNKSCDAVRVDFSPACFLTHNDKVYRENGTKRIDLTHDLFDNDAIFLYNVAKEIKLGSDKTTRSVTLSFNGMKYIGLWHAVKTDAPYVCIEPWTSVPATQDKVDDLTTKEEMIHLPSGYTYKNGYSITIK
ncbi:MAG: aldose 1-epimerase family protein [Clostridia bacterium]|nr:aldose 1-epimerase family protein [Clostridia bacterium]